VTFSRLPVTLAIGLFLTLFDATAEAQRIAFLATTGPAPQPGELAPLLDALEAQGILVSPSKIRSALGARLPIAAHDPALSSAAYAKLLDQAHSVWIQQPPLEKMLPVLDAAVEVIRRNPILLIRDPSQRERVHKLLVARALAYQRIGDLERSEGSMAELICMSPNHVVSRSKDGPAAEQLYQLTRANQVRRGRGTLTVKVSHPDVQVYVDERITRPGVPITDLIPCLHRVVLLDPLDRARQYEPVVASHRHTLLEVDWDVDPAVHVTPGWIELRFQTETERQQRAELARRLVQLAPGADAFVLIDVIVENRERHVIGSLRAVRGGQVLREASLVMPGTDATALRALARFLGGGPADESIRIHVLIDLAIQRDPAGAGAPARSRSSPWMRTRKYVVSAAAVTAIAGGVAAIYIGQDQPCGAISVNRGPLCPQRVLLIAAGGIAALAGALLAGTAAYFWSTDPPPRRRVGLQLDPGRRGGAVVTTWRFP
jgi:hypothetical protein